MGGPQSSGAATEALDTTRQSYQSADATVEVFWMALDTAAADPARFARLLSPGERARAERFRYARDRRRFVVRRGRLRELLADRIGCAPEEVRLACDAFGKPRIASSALSFNLSHSDGIALYAIARGREVGCDIEWRDERLAPRAVAERFFSPREVEMLNALPREAWVAGFFNCWTRKEAFVKACGLGLSAPLHAFDVSLAPGEPAALLRGGEGWSLRAFEPMAGLHAAVVAEGDDWRLARPPREWETCPSS